MLRATAPALMAGAAAAAAAARHHKALSGKDIVTLYLLAFAAAAAALLALRAAVWSLAHALRLAAAASRLLLCAAGGAAMLPLRLAAAATIALLRVGRWAASNKGALLAAAVAMCACSNPGALHSAVARVPAHALLLASSWLDDGECWRGHQLRKLAARLYAWSADCRGRSCPQCGAFFSWLLLAARSQAARLYWEHGAARCKPRPPPVLRVAPRT